MRTLLVVASTIAVAFLSPARADQKVDVLGLSAGMPSDAVTNVVKEKGWTCRNTNAPMSPIAPDPDTGDISFSCNTSTGQLNLMLAGSLSERPLAYLRLFFNSADNIANVSESISKQYGVDSTVSSNGGLLGQGYSWKLNNGSVLEMFYVSDKYMLNLYSKSILEQNLKAKAAKVLARHPAPKF